MFSKVTARANHPVNIMHTVRGSIVHAGFTNIHEQHYKVPVGDWPKNQMYKEFGTMNMLASKEGVEGYALYFLTTHGVPEPWSLAGDKGGVGYAVESIPDAKRVWAQKPF